ncbi:unnamed protein product [Calicophoron daubneyi]|uniref:Snake toxin/toxin-like domain-containing protein n=1 Tax=Calicophoron daubneyi TaxID=300641 RepID=A0AAV2TWK9_CALDB
MDSKYLIILSILFITLTSASAKKYKCYKCDPCPEPFKKTDVKIKEECDYCGKTTNYVGKAVVTKRSCRDSCTPSVTDVMGTRIRVDCCTGNLCNSGRGTHYSFVLLAATGLFSLVLSVLVH